MGISVGIDLGTTYCAVAWINPATQTPEIIRNSEDSNITPSVIQFMPDGSHICGAAAKDAFERGEYGCVNTFKRYMGTDQICCSAYGKEYTARELSALLLRHLKEEAELTLGQNIDKAVITVPAYFFTAERKDTLLAAQDAGLEVIQLINEPTAAAMNYGLKHWRENAIIMVYDLGGGTFDVTLVGMDKDYQMETIATVGNHELGGKDWDSVLAGIVMDKLYNETGVDIRGCQETENEIRTMVETWKKRLTNFPKVDCKVNVPDYGTTAVTVTREEFEDATVSLLNQTRYLCEDVLEKKHLNWSNVTDVLLVGGSTRMLQVSTMLECITHKKPLTHVHPDEAVAIGAAMQTGIKKADYVVLNELPAVDKPATKGGLFGFGKKTESAKTTSINDIALKYSAPVKSSVGLENFAVIGIKDAQAHGMGVISISVDGTEYINENIIPQNSPIPVKCAREFKFYTNAKGDNELEIFVLEGEEKKPLENTINAKYVVKGIRHVKGGTRIRIQYSFDRNSIIHVQARQEDNDYDLPISEVPIDYQELEKFGRPVEQDISAGASDLTIALAIDVSGSMSGSPIEDAKKAMISFVDQFEDTGARIGAIAVSDTAKWVVFPTDDHDRCVKGIRSIESCMTGVCNEGHPFDLIKSELEYEKGIRYAIILADGMWENTSRAIRAAKECNRVGIETAAIGFGSADSEFLDDISSQKDLSIMTSQSELTHSFGKIAQSIGTGGGKKGRDGKESSTQTWATND